LEIGITGGDGTLGQLLRKRLATAPGTVSSFDGDLRSAFAVESWVRGLRPARVVHLAARVALDDVQRDPLAAFAVNVQGTAHLLGALAGLGTKPWLFYAGTSHVYSSLDRPIGEDGAIQPQNTYGETKWLAEQLVRFFAKHGAVRACVGRIFSFYHRSQSKPFLYPSIVERLAGHDRTKPLQLRGGNNIRDLSNAEDVIEAIVRLMDRECEGVVNIGSGVGKRIADFVRELAGHDVEIEVPPDDPVTSLVADVSRLRSLVGHG